MHASPRARWAVAAVALVSAGLLTACRSTGGTPAASTPAVTAGPATPAAQYTPLSDDEVKSLTLDAGEFGPSFANYREAATNASMVLAARAGDRCYGELVAEMQRRGFVRGYLRAWVPDAGAAADAPKSVGSSVQVFPDAESARAQLAFDAAWVSKPWPPGCDLEPSPGEAFSVDVIGDEAVGYRRTMGDGDTKLTFTWIEFRRGNVVANADIIRDDARDASAETTPFARTLDAKLARFLSRR